MTVIAQHPQLALAELRELADSLSTDGRHKDALLLLEHLDALQSGNVETLREIVRMLAADGQILKAIEKLGLMRAVATDTEAFVADLRTHMPAAIKCFNDHLAANEIVEAEKYAAGLAALAPGNPALLNAALSCNAALGRNAEAAKYAAALLKLDPAHEQARATIAAQPKEEAHPLIRLRNLYDAASVILCNPLDEAAIAQVQQLLETAAALTIDLPAESEWAGWAKHYRLASKALDLPMMLGATPTPAKEDAAALLSSAGEALNWTKLQALAKRLKAKTVFFAAADRAYVDLYARWYIKSILKFCDVDCLIVVHVIGGAGELKAVAKAVGIKDKRLVFAGDRFVADAVTTKCYDAPPKGLIAKPVAHFQSVRFLRLGALLQKLQLPVFVSDIDLLLQRGVADLLQRSAKADIVLNENAANTNAGSRLTANLLLVNPTATTNRFLRFLKSYLERALAAPEVSRWIDQFGLLMARNHLLLNAKNARIEYFDTESDINNVMYRSYQEHPFRFLSLYHGFDTSSLETNADAVMRKKPPARKAA